MSNQFLDFQTELASNYKYQKLPDELSEEMRQKYLDELPLGLKLEGDPDFKLLTLSGTLIANGYTRIVVGDYGAFIEISPEQMVKEILKIKKGQEYRIKDIKYKENVKYFWLTAKDESDIKIYLQQKTVSYANYQPKMFYVSPYEILT